MIWFLLCVVLELWICVSILVFQVDIRVKNAISLLFFVYPVEKSMRFGAFVQRDFVSASWQPNFCWWAVGRMAKFAVHYWYIVCLEKCRQHTRKVKKQIEIDKLHRVWRHSLSSDVTHQWKISLKISYVSDK